MAAIATRFYLRATTANVGTHARTELSTTLPTGTLDDGGFAAKDLSRTIGTTETTYVNTALAQTAQQSDYFAKWISEALVGVTAIAANTWTVGIRAAQSAAQHNGFIRVSIYVLTAADAVRGYVYDGTADLGLELTGNGQVYSVAGAAVSGVVDTDRLVIEVWDVATQSMATGYTSTVYYDGPAAVTDGTTNSGAYLETPENVFPPSLTSGNAGDIQRDWATPYQDLSVNFSEGVTRLGAAYAVGDTIPGLTVSIAGGAEQALTYRSGDATAGWVVRLAALVKNGQTIEIDYARATGELYNLGETTEIADATNVSLTNSLTKRIRETIKNAAGTALNAVTVKYGVFQYDTGAPANANWMTRDQKGTVATSATGVFDIQYTGAAAVDGTAYLVVIQPDTTPTESTVWTSTVT